MIYGLVCMNVITACGVEAEHFVPAMITCIRKCKGGYTTAPPQGSYAYDNLQFTFHSWSVSTSSTVYLPAVSGGGGRNLRILKTIQCQTREIKWLPWIEV